MAAPGIVLDVRALCETMRVARSSLEQQGSLSMESGGAGVDRRGKRTHRLRPPRAPRPPRGHQPGGPPPRGGKLVNISGTGGEWRGPPPPRLRHAAPFFF